MTAVSCLSIATNLVCYRIIEDAVPDALVADYDAA